MPTRHDFPVAIATMPASARQRRTAFGVFLVLAALLGAALPFAHIPLPRVDAFVPVIQTVMCVADLLTAVLLFAQYAVAPQRALLVLAAGYMFSGLFAFLQALAFPGAFGPGTLIGDPLNSAGWLFVLWHMAFPLAVIGYTLTRDAGEATPSSTRSTGITIAIVIAGVAAATAALTWAVLAGAEYLPPLFSDPVTQTPAAHVANICLVLLGGVALAALLARRHTVLDHWLIVTLLAWLPNLIVAALFTVTRFTFGWYASRVYALFAGSSVLFALLGETVVLYTRLANAFVLLRRERAERLAIFNTVVDGIITIDRSGMVTSLNPTAARLFGYAPEEVIGRNVRTLMPEPYRAQHDGYLANYLTTGQAKIIGIGRAVTGLRRDGSVFPIELAVSETAVAGRTIFTGVVRDITERRRADEHQRLLIAELDHRVKNVLARVAALVESTRHDGGTTEEFATALDGRIQSLAAAHGLLSQSGWQGVGLGALVHKQLAPYATNANVTVSGADIVLTATATQAVAMTLHELVTNAAKYGALSVPAGGVSVGWESRSDASGAAMLRIEWRERDGPPVTSSIRPGYGTNLIRDLIPHELGGAVDLVFAPDGAVCAIEVPLRAAAGPETWE
jgi:PAS domain S-box-containing protein